MAEEHRRIKSNLTTLIFQISYSFSTYFTHKPSINHIITNLTNWGKIETMAAVKQEEKEGKLNSHLHHTLSASRHPNNLQFEIGQYPHTHVVPNLPISLKIEN